MLDVAAGTKHNVRREHDEIYRFINSLDGLHMIHECVLLFRRCTVVHVKKTVTHLEQASKCGRAVTI